MPTTTAQHTYEPVSRTTLAEGDVIQISDADVEILTIGRDDCRKGFGHRHDCPPGSRWFARVRGVTTQDRDRTSHIPWTTALCLVLEGESNLARLRVS